MSARKAKPETTDDILGDFLGTKKPKREPRLPASTPLAKANARPRKKKRRVKPKYERLPPYVLEDLKTPLVLSDDDLAAPPSLVFVVDIDTIGETNSTAGVHWGERLRRVELAHARVKEATDRETTAKLAYEFPMVVRLTRIYPDKSGRGLDLDDNLNGSMKHVRDAVAKWLAVDDGKAHLIRFVYGQEINRTYMKRSFDERGIQIYDPHAEPQQIRAVRVELFERKRLVICMEDVA